MKCTICKKNNATQYEAIKTNIKKPVCDECIYEYEKYEDAKEEERKLDALLDRLDATMPRWK